MVGPKGEKKITWSLALFDGEKYPDTAGETRGRLLLLIWLLIRTQHLSYGSSQRYSKLVLYQRWCERYVSFSFLACDLVFRQCRNVSYDESMTIWIARCKIWKMECLDPWKTSLSNDHWFQTFPPATCQWNCQNAMKACKAKNGVLGSMLLLQSRTGNQSVCYHSFYRSNLLKRS